MLLEASTLAAVAALSIGAAIVGGMGGFGTGVILAAALVPLIGVKALVPVMAVAGVIINAGRFWFYRDSLERRTLGVVLVSALPFLMFGTWLYSQTQLRIHVLVCNAFLRSLAQTDLWPVSESERRPSGDPAATDPGWQSPGSYA